MAGKYWWEESEEQQKDTNGQGNAQGSSAQGYWWDNIAPTVSNNIVNRVSTYLDNHNSYITDYQNRYSSRKGNYEDAYVSDSAKWLQTVQSRNNSLDAEANEILSYMDQYKGYLDADWMKQVREAITSTGDVHKSIYDVADKDNQYWSSFGTEELLKAHGSAEEAYKYGQRIDGYSKKYEGKTSTELQGLIGSLEDGEEKEWLKYYEDIVGRNELLSVGNSASKNYDPNFDKYVAQGKEYLYMTDQEYNRRIAEYDDMYFNASTNEERQEALAQMNALQMQYNNIKRTAPNFEGLDEDERQVYLYHLGKDLETGAMDYSNAFFEDLTGRKNNAIQNNSPQAHFFQNSELFDDGYQFGDVFLTAAGSVADLGVNAVKGAVRNVEGMVDFLGYGVAGVADLVGADGFADSTRDAMRWSATDAALGGVSDYVDQASIFGSTIDSVGEGIGQVFSLGKAVGLAQKAFNLGKVGTNVVSSLLTYSSSAGLGITEAYENNATNGEAYAYGAIAGLAETVSELLWGGIGKSANMFGLSGSTVGLDELVSKNVSKVFSGTFGRNLAQYAVSGAFEGVEEVLAGLGQAVAKKMTYLSEEDLGKIIADENLLEQFIVGTITGYLVQTPDLISKTKAGRDLITGLTDSETFLLDTEFNSYLQESKAEGYDLSKKQQNELYEKAKGIIRNVNKKMEKEAAQVTKDAMKAAKKSGIPTSNVRPASAKLLTRDEVREVLAANNSLITAEDTKKIQTAAEERLKSLGETENVSQIAELATKRALGQRLTRSEKSILANSEYGARVANELVPENIMSGEYASEWAEDIGTKQINKFAYNIKSIVDAMAEDPNAYKSLEDRMKTETPSQVSSTGKAVIRGADEEIDLTNIKVKAISEDGVVLDVKGRDVDTREIDFANEDQWNMFNALKKIEHITPGVATDMIAKVDMSKPVWGQLNGLDEAFTYGYYGYSEADLKAGNFTGNLTKVQLNDAYKLGQYVAKNDVADKTAAIKKMRTEADAIAEKAAAKGKEAPKSKNMTITYNKGNGEVVSIDDAGIKDAKRSGAVGVAKILHKLGLGTRVEFFDSFESKTKMVKDRKTGKMKLARVFINDQGVEQIAYSGVYRKSDGTIRVDLNAYNGRGLTLNALAHELTHFIQQWSDKKYKILADFLVKTYEGTDMTMHKRVLREQKRLEDIRGEEVSYDEAFDEVVANAMSKMFDDGKLVERLTELKAQDEKLARKLWEGFKKIMSKFLGIYQESPALFDDAGDLVAMKDTFEQLQGMFAEALVEASENYQAALTVNESQTLAESSKEAGTQQSSQKTDLDKDFDYSDLNWASDLGIITAKDRAIFERTINNEIFRGAEPQSANGEYIIDTGKCLMFTDGDFHSPTLSRVIVFDTEYESLTADVKEMIYDDAKTSRNLQASLETIKKMFRPGFLSIQNKPVGYPNGRKVRGRKGSNRSGSNQKVRSIKEMLAAEGKEHLLYSSQETDLDSEGNQLSKEQVEYFKNSKVRDKKGNLLTVYHGTTANFNTFKKGDVGFHFGTKGAARGRVGYSENVNIKAVYLNITNPIVFDEDLGSWDADYRLTQELYDRGILSREEAMAVLRTDDGRYKRSTEAANKKLASVLMDKGYDGIAYQNTFETKKATTSYIAFSSNQAKETTNTNPTTNPDIRYSSQETDLDTKTHPYAYDILVSKPDMRVTTVDVNVPKNRADVVYQAKQNAAKVGKFDPKTGSVSVYVDDVGEYVALGTPGLKHGLEARRAENAIVTLRAGEILKHSVRINELIPKKENVDSSYVLVGAAKDDKGSFYIVRSVVNRVTHKLMSMDVLYAINAKKENRLRSMRPGFQGPVADSTISIADLLDLVNRYFPDVLPEDVLKHYGYEARPEGDLGESALYSEHDTDYTNRDLLANAFEGITQNSEEYKLIQQYKGRIKLLNEYEEKLSKLNAEIREIRFGKGKYDAERLAQLEAKAKEMAKLISKNDKKLLSLEASEPLRKVIEQERRKEAQKTKEHVQEIQQNKKLRAEQAEYRHKIRKVIRDLDKLLNRGNKKTNVKEDMRGFVSKALQSAEILFTDNYGTYDMLRNGIGTEMSDAEEALVKTCAKMLKELDEMPSDGYDNWQARQEAENRLRAKMTNLKEVFARERKRLNNTTVSSILGELADSYAALEDSDQRYVQGAYSEPVHNFLKNLQKEVGGTIVMDMTKNQLESVYAAYNMVLNTVRNVNRMFNEELKQSREQLGNAVIEEVLKAGGVHLLGTKTGDKISQFDWNNMKPIWVGNRIGSDTFSKLINGLFKGQYRFAVDIAETKKFKLDMDKKHHPREWDTEKLYEFESSTGKKFSLNLQQIMSLYAFSKRDQAYSHLRNGGFVFDENSTVVVDGKLGIKKTYIHKGATSYKLNEATLNGIINSLTAEQKAYVDEMQKFLSETMGAKGNEVSMQLYGIKMFKEKFYFPLRSSGDYMERAKEAEMKKQQGQINLVNSGFTHSVKPQAKNPIVLSEFMDVWAEHCNEMSMYHSMVLPMEDFRKVYNYTTMHDENMDSASVFQTIKDAYGKAATDYIDQLYRELNAGATVDPRETPWMQLISNFKKAAVMLSGSVVVQQFSSIGRAYAIIDPKYFVGAKVDSDTRLSVVEEMKKYAPVAIIKEMGGFDTGTKGSAKSYITAEQYGKGERIKGLLKDKQYRNDLMGFLPQWADEKTWCAIWEAAKRETKAKNPKIDVKSEEFLKLAGDRFSEVIEKTQVYDSVLARSANMRSKGGFMQMATAFMAEPTSTINLLEDAIRSGNAKRIARTFGAVAVCILLNNALASIVYAMRDDDEDETFIEKYFQSFTSGIIDDLNPMSYYPFIKDVYSIFQGYDVERADMSIIADVRDAMKKAVGLLGKDTSGMDDDELAAYYKQLNEVFMGILDAGCSMFGVPVKNVRRDVNGLINAWNTVSEDVSGERNTTWLSFWDKVGEAAKDTIPVYAWTKDRSKTDKLYDAIVNGDKTYLDRLKSTYSTDTAYQNAVRKALRENDPRIHESARARYEGRTEEYKRIFRQIQGEGKFHFDDIMGAINSEVNSISNGAETEKATSSYNANGFIEAVILNDRSSANTMKQDIISTYMANGYTRDDAEKSFMSNVTGSIEDAYFSGLLTETRAKKMLQEYAGKDEEEAASKVNYWAFCEKYPAYEDVFTESHLDKYNEFAKPVGISVAVYARYISGTKGPSTKKQVVNYIHSLPLTRKQKDALYLAREYAQSTLWDTPWNN